MLKQRDLNEHKKEATEIGNYIQRTNGVLPLDNQAFFHPSPQRTGRGTSRRHMQSSAINIC